MYWLFLYASNYIFSQTTIEKPQSEAFETLTNVRSSWCSCKVLKEELPVLNGASLLDYYLYNSPFEKLSFEKITKY